MINRALETKITSLSWQLPVLIVTGARQTGKTTLLKHVFPKLNYVSLDLPSLAEQAEHNPDEFLSRNRPDGVFPRRRRDDLKRLPIHGRTLGNLYLRRTAEKKRHCSLAKKHLVLPRPIHQ